MKNLLQQQERYKLDLEIYNGIVSQEDMKNVSYPLLITITNRLGEK